MENGFIKLDLTDLLSCINSNEFTVKTEPHNKVKDEFNKFVKKEITTRRNNSTIIEMRNFHNFIKRTLLVNISEKLYRENRKPVNLVDIAVGRGGDLAKWKDARIKHVFGFDISSEAINSINPFNQGAKERYRLSKGMPDVIFEVGDATNPTQDLLKKLYDFRNTYSVQIVSCQFALHYFVGNEKQLRNVLQLVSNVLTSGGYFVGTTTDGKKIKKSKGNSLFEIKQKQKNYSFKINDTIDQGNYFNTIPESIEYYTDFKKLNRLASEYNLVPDNTNFFEKYNGGYTHLDILINNISFSDIPNGSFNMTPEQSELNELYSTFLFRKI
jgi:mRNA (guanine-N7-)-methyltransferase